MAAGTLLAFSIPSQTFVSSCSRTSGMSSTAFSQVLNSAVRSASPLLFELRRAFACVFDCGSEARGAACGGAPTCEDGAR